MIGSSSARIEERLTDDDVIVVEVFREPLLGHRLLVELDISLRDEVGVGLVTCGGSFCPGDPAPQRQCAWLWSTTSRKRKVKDSRKCRKIRGLKRRKVR